MDTKERIEALIKEINPRIGGNEYWIREALKLSIDGYPHEFIEALKCIEKEQDRITELENENENLSRKITELENEIENLSRKIMDLEDELG